MPAVNERGSDIAEGQKHEKSHFKRPALGA